MATIRPRSTNPLPYQEKALGEVFFLPFCLKDKDERVECLCVVEETTQSIEEAEVVIAGGKGMKKGENFALLEELANLLGGVVGASRDAVDRGWAVYPKQIGLSGKTISSKLYVGVGISGTVQHVAGIKTVEHSIAINKDPQAPIFQYVDLGMVGDLFDILPALIERLFAYRREV